MTKIEHSEFETETEQGNAHKLVTSILEKADSPLSTFDAFNLANKETSTIGRVPFQRAVWDLVDSGKIIVTSDRRLTL